MEQAIRVAIRLSTGGVAIMSFLTRGRGSHLPYGATWSDTPGVWLREPSGENIFQEVSRAFATDPQPVGFRVISEDEIPADRTYRNALVDEGGVLKHDMPRAREIHLARLRRERVLKLEELDREFSRAFGQGMPTKEIEAKRQRLRDMPQEVAPALAAATTTAELKAITFPE